MKKNIKLKKPRNFVYIFYILTQKRNESTMKYDWFKQNNGKSLYIRKSYNFPKYIKNYTCCSIIYLPKKRIYARTIQASLPLKNKLKEKKNMLNFDRITY